LTLIIKIVKDLLECNINQIEYYFSKPDSQKGDQILHGGGRRFEPGWAHKFFLSYLLF